MRDECAGYFAGTEVESTIKEISLASAQGWEVRQEGDTWAAATSAPGDPEGNKEGADPIHFRYKMSWNTMSHPLGNNGPHTLFAGEEQEDEWVIAHVEFEEWVVGTGWTNAYEAGPTPKSANCENVYIADCTASNGTVDYFKWDPDGDAGLAQPHITFTIEDADPHKYAVIMRYRQTMGEGTWDWDTGGWSW